MQNKICICENPIQRVYNIHCKNRNINMSLLNDNEGYAIIVSELGEVIAVFDIDYCPKCGRKLE